VNRKGGSRVSRFFLRRLGAGDSRSSMRNAAGKPPDTQYAAARYLHPLKARWIALSSGFMPSSLWEEKDSLN
jgi:hypothetical protein